jgi:hypothetical protein
MVHSKSESSGKFPNPPAEPLTQKNRSPTVKERNRLRPRRQAQFEMSLPHDIAASLVCRTYINFTSICLGIAAEFLGKVTVSIPSLNSATTLLPSTNGGRVKILMNSPYFRSMR